MVCAQAIMPLNNYNGLNKSYTITSYKISFHTNFIESCGRLDTIQNLILKIPLSYIGPKTVYSEGLIGVLTHFLVLLYDAGHYIATEIDKYVTTEHWWNDISKGNRSTRRNLCPRVTFPPQILRSASVPPCKYRTSASY